MYSYEKGRGEEEGGGYERDEKHFGKSQSGLRKDLLGL